MTLHFSDYFKLVVNFRVTSGMLLGIAADLSIPPSSPSVFRDVTLYSKVFRRYDVVAISEAEMIDLYVKWFRQYGLFDFVDAIVRPGEILSFNVEIVSGKLTAHCLRDVIALL